jgi:hypothetical protein
MDQDQENLVGMFETVDGYLGRNSTVWSGFKAFSDARTELTAGIAFIRGKEVKQTIPITGVAEGKQDLRDELEDKLFEVADLTSAWAAAAGDMEAAAVVEITRSALDNLSGDALETLAKQVAGIAQAHLAELTDYAVTAADVADLTAKTAAFSGVKTAPRLAISGRAGETATLPEAIQSTRLLLRNRIDKLVTKFRKSHPEFVAGYKAARVIVDRRGGGGSAPEETPTNPPA